MTQDVQAKPARKKTADGATAGAKAKPGAGVGAKPKGKQGAATGAKSAPKAAASGPARSPAGTPSGGAPLPAVDTGEKMRRADLIAAVVERTDMKRNQVTKVVEATLAAIAEALLEGRQLALPPLGTARVSRMSEAGKSKVMVVRLRQGTKQPKAAAAGGTDAKDGLADGGEDD